MGINVLRAQPAWSAAAWCAHPSSDPLWRFVNVRRLVMMVMKAINLSTQWAVFEPNDHDTRTRIALALTEFLTALWGRGALVGPSPEQSFVVRCDESNNPPEARVNGQLLAEVAHCAVATLRVRGAAHRKTRQLVRNHRRPAGGRGRECMSIDERLDQ